MMDPRPDWDVEFHCENVKESKLRYFVNGTVDENGDMIERKIEQEAVNDTIDGRV